MWKCWTPWGLVRERLIRADITQERSCILVELEDSSVCACGGWGQEARAGECKEKAYLGTAELGTAITLRMYWSTRRRPHVVSLGFDCSLSLSFLLEIPRWLPSSTLNLTSAIWPFQQLLYLDLPLFPFPSPLLPFLSYTPFINIRIQWLKSTTVIVYKHDQALNKGHKVVIRYWVIWEKAVDCQ